MKSVLAALAAGSLAAMTAVASSESNPTAVFVNAGMSSFWHTATNAVITVPVEYPSGATSARIVVSGSGYYQEYSDITAMTVDISLPPATSQETEDVYDLTLSFVGNDTERTARIGLVRGYGAVGEGTTRCLVNVSESKWRRVKGTHAVLPVPYGAEFVSIDGVPTDAGLKGDQGWYSLQSGDRELPATVELSVNDGVEEYEGVVCFRPAGGMTILLR